MDFSLSAEQRELIEASTAFARRELNQDLAKRDDAAEFPWDAWRACASFEIHAVDVPFLGRRVRLLPGVVTLAQLAGAPVLMGFLHRSPDYSHQVLEISAPLPVGGGKAMAFGRCAAEVSDAISGSPAHWRYWASTADLADLGLVLPERDRSLQRDPVPLPDEGFLNDRTAGRLAAPD